MAMNTFSSLESGVHSSFAQSGIVRIIVGTPRTCYNVHEKVITDASHFFAVCLNTRSLFVESQTNEVYFPEDTEENFNLVIEWIYNKTIIYSQKAGTDKHYSAHLVADKYGIPGLKNELMDKIRTFHWMDLAMFLMTYEVPESELASMIIDRIALVITQESAMTLTTVATGEGSEDPESIKLNNYFGGVDQACHARVVSQVHRIKNGGYIVPSQHTKGCFYHDHSHNKSSSCF